MDNNNNETIVEYRGCIRGIDNILLNDRLELLDETFLKLALLAAVVTVVSSVMYGFCRIIGFGHSVFSWLALVGLGAFVVGYVGHLLFHAMAERMWK